MISNWLREQIQTPATNVDAIANMAEFFKEMKSRNYPPKARHEGDMIEQAELSESEEDEQQN